jgi:CheY-like chemotaxis protein
MPFRKKTVLLADDNKTFVMYMSIILNRMGLNVVPAADGLEAMRLLKVIPPDLVMLDIKMPVVDGIDTLEQIKSHEKFSQIPVAMLTADSTKETIEGCREMGCSGYLTKPVVLHELHNVLEECIFSPLGWKRKHMRAHRNIKAIITHKGESHELFTESVSGGGVYLRKKDPLPVGSDIDITLHLDDSTALDLKGTVIYTKELYGDVFKVPPGMAVEFSDMKTEDSRVLAEHVSRLIAADVLESQEETVITKNWN